MATGAGEADMLPNQRTTKREIGTVTYQFRNVIVSKFRASKASLSRSCKNQTLLQSAAFDTSRQKIQRIAQYNQHDAHTASSELATLQRAENHHQPDHNCIGPQLEAANSLQRIR